MPLSLAQFVDQLAASTLMSLEEITAFRAGLAAEGISYEDAQEFARELIRRKKLTPWQATAIYRGEQSSLIYGNYVVLDKLGQGGMGVVYKARHRRMNRLVALKVMSPLAMRSPDSVKRFHREVQTAAKLSHPNIVAAHDADEAGGVHFLVMEFVEGTDLAGLVKKNGPLPLDLAVRCIIQAARGLAYAHGEGVVHRDIKPANLLLMARRARPEAAARSDPSPPLHKGGPGGVASGAEDHAEPSESPPLTPPYEGGECAMVKILDMGLARLTGGTGDASDGLTQTGNIMGTVDYMSPEQALDTKHADARSDIYALGCTLCYLLTGRPVYSGDTVMKKLLAHREQAIPSLAAVRPDLPAGLDAVFARMVAKSPGDRHASMNEVVADLEACLAARPMAVGAAAGASPFGAGGLPGADSRTLGSDDPAIQAFLEAISPAGNSASVRTRLGAQPASETMASRVGDHTAIGGRRSRSTAWRRLTSRQRWLAGSAAVGVLMIAASIWVLSGGKPRGTSSTGRLSAESAGSANEAGNSDDRVQRRRENAPPMAVAPFDAAQAAGHQQAWADYLGVPVEHTNSIGMTFRLIPPGEFLMGSTDEDVHQVLIGNDHPYWRQMFQSESPRHKVVLTRPLYVGVHEVTQKEYADITGTNPSNFFPRGAAQDEGAQLDTTRHPVETVSWNDAAAFCAELSRRESLKPAYERTGEVVTLLGGDGYRLPTEAEWEFGCRAGTITQYWSGDRDDDLHEAGWAFTNAGNRLHTVGELRANPFGLYDVHGNVWEWCQDLFGSAYYAEFHKQAAVNPTGPGKGETRVARSGAFCDVPRANRTAVRRSCEATYRNGCLGFRIVLPVSSVRPAARQQPVATASPAPRPNSALQKWMTKVVSLGAEEQAAEVKAKLKELNPGFDGMASHKLENSAVTEFSLVTDNITDISPLKALPWLKTLNCVGTPPDRGMLRDLAPLAGLHLVTLDCSYNPQVDDLAPLAEMSLLNMNCSVTSICDLSPLAGMKLQILNCASTGVTDLAPLAGMPLVHLGFWNTPVSTLKPLAGMKLASLVIDGTRVTDLTPLRGMMLTFISLSDTAIDDLAPLAGMPMERLHVLNCPKLSGLSPLADAPLKNLMCDFNRWRDEEVLRSITTPEKINSQPAAAFWNEVNREKAAFESWCAKIAALPPDDQVQAVAVRLRELNPGFNGSVSHQVENGVVAELKILADGVTDLSPVRALARLARLVCSPGDAGKGPLSDLWPLRGMALASLDCHGTTVRDLSPLAGMPLEALTISGTDVADLSSLATTKLKVLHLDATPVADLSPLGGLALEELSCADSHVRDLAPLENVSLKALGIDFNYARDAARLRGMKTLEAINGKPAAEFLKAAEAKHVAFEAWIRTVADLPPVQQVRAVAAKLKELDPGFDGSTNHAVADGAVYRLEFSSEDVSDLSPVQALPGLTFLNCSGGPVKRGKLADLSPLAGMKLTTLLCSRTQVRDLAPLANVPLVSLTVHDTPVNDLSPLAKMPLTYLHIGQTKVADLTPLKDLPLIFLNAFNTNVTDLSPLREMSLIDLELTSTPVADISAVRGMPLEHLGIAETRVTNLSALRGMPLKNLQCHQTAIYDLSPLAGMKLTILNVQNCPGVSDLSVLKGMPLETLWCDYSPLRDAGVLRSIKMLKQINDKQAREYFEK